MLDLARDIIGSQPILTAFLAIGLGYLVGQISIFGFSLGVGAVLFVGLAIGAFAPKAQIVGPIGLTGLIMFLYGIGILYGRQFFEGMVGSVGINAINDYVDVGVGGSARADRGIGALIGRFPPLIIVEMCLRAWSGSFEEYGHGGACTAAIEIRGDDAVVAF